MGSLVLAAALAAQLPPMDAAEMAVRDLRFVGAVEDFVMAARPGWRPPDPFGNLIERLGNPAWATRDAAGKALQEASADDLRWLFWGRRHPDLEVRMRSNAIIRRLTPCPPCKGTGRVIGWDSQACYSCGGSGSTWTWAMWD